jgi:hypothetical protein
VITKPRIIFTYNEDGTVQVSSRSKKKVIKAYCLILQDYLNRNLLKLKKLISDKIEEEMWKPAIQKSYWFKK